MDPDRVRAYLQVACAGLGFDIGEIWWTQSDESSSALAAIEKRDENTTLTAQGGQKLHFVQLYTSKSYEDRRNMLIKPADEEENYNAMVNGNSPNDHSAENEKHVLSPLLVDAISKTAQVVWAHTRKQEGLLGRSDIRLQTAVGMPVAVDGDGNMCVVVMFSPNNIQSTDDAMEYLQSISRSATSSTIPSLLPAFDPKQGIVSLPHHHPSNEVIPLLSSPRLSDGVTTRFVSLDDAPIDSAPLSVPEVHSEHDLANAPKDCFGIPMLPSIAEMGGASNGGLAEVQGLPSSDAFDEASYGVWSTIMETFDDKAGLLTDTATTEYATNTSGYKEPLPIETSTPVYAMNKPFMAKERRERLEEFSNAFLNVSVFDVAEVWVPIGGQSDFLGQVTSISSTDSNDALNEFQTLGEKILVKYWSGAIGRAFSSGNPVWSANREVFVDSGRSSLFSQVKIETALAVPVFSGKAPTPAFIFCCYSFVRTGSVPFVLKFVQQALRLLWDGLDKVQPHKSVGEEVWKDVAPADLGEMAADVEMHEHFMIKKRPYNSISSSRQTPNNMDSSLAAHLGTMSTPSGIPSVRSIYTGDEQTSPELGATVAPIGYQTYESVQGHIQEAVRCVAEMKPVHHHVSTNVQGTKRAHVYAPPEPSQLQQLALPGQETQASPPPLPMPTPLPLPNQPFIQPGSIDVPSHLPTQQLTQSASAIPAQNQAPDTRATIQTQTYLQAQYDQSQSQPSLSQTGYYQPQPPPQYSQSIEVGAPGQTQDRASSSLLHTQVPPAQLQAPASANSIPMPTPLGSIPMDRISATGITFPVAPTNQTIGLQNSVPVAQSPATLTAQQQYCVPIQNQGKTYPNVNLNTKPCRIQGCNEPSVARRPYCVAHSGNRMCEHPGCPKCAQGSTRFCIAHGGGRRCTFPGCDKGARDKFFCAAHGGGKRCKFEGCNKSAVGGSNLCTAHGGGRRCSVEGCDKSAQSSTKFCVKHGGGKKCSHPGCEKVARGRTQFCAAHGGGIRCKLEGCNRVAIGKLQLCRAHGGGSRPRPRKPNSFAPVALEGVPQMPNFSDMASI